MIRTLATFRVAQFVCGLFLMCASVPCFAKQGTVLVQVKDAQGRAVSGIQIGVDGVGGTGFTGDDGKVQLALGNAAKPGDPVTLQVLNSPAGKDYVFVSPWTSWFLVPSFEGKPNDFVPIVVVQRGERAALENGMVVASLAERIISSEARKQSGNLAPSTDPKANLEAVAKQYGLDPDEVDKAIRDWGKNNATDPYASGLVALYIHNYPKATEEFKNSLRRREARLAIDQDKVTADREDVARAAFFLGSSLYAQGRYSESAVAFKRGLELKPGTPGILSRLSLALFDAGDYRGAEPLMRELLDEDEKAFGHDHLNVASDSDDLAQLLETEGKYTEAEGLTRHALSIREKQQGKSGRLLEALSLNNLGALLHQEHEFEKAEYRYKQALNIRESILGPNNLDTANSFASLGFLYRDEKKYSEALQDLNNALSIQQEQLGHDHPVVAATINNLALVLQDEGNYANAERQFREALRIAEKMLGPDHPTTATYLNNLAYLLATEGEHAKAEPFYQRALAIAQKVLGPNHPTTAQIRANLAESVAKEKQRERRQ